MRYLALIALFPLSPFRSRYRKEHNGPFVRLELLKMVKVSNNLLGSNSFNRCPAVAIFGQRKPPTPPRCPQRTCNYFRPINLIKAAR